jgi:hypothetical protein
VQAIAPAGGCALQATVRHWSPAGEAAFKADGEIWFRRRQKTVSIACRDDQAEIGPMRLTSICPVPICVLLPLMIVPVATLMQILLAPQGLGMRDRYGKLHSVV